MTLTYDDLTTTTIRCDGEDCGEFSPIGEPAHTLYHAHALARRKAKAAGWVVARDVATLCPACVKRALEAAAEREASEGA